VKTEQTYNILELQVISTNKTHSPCHRRSNYCQL